MVLKNNDTTTLAILNAGESADMKVITSSILTTKREVKCLEIPHLEEHRPLALIVTRHSNHEFSRKDT